MTPYPEMCGPAALAALLGCTCDKAADRLRDIETPSRSGSTTIFTMVTAIKQDGWQADIARFRRDQRPTVARFVRERPAGTYLILASHHFMVLRDGRIVEANGYTKRRGLVVWYARVYREGDPEPDQTWACRCGCGSGLTAEAIKRGRFYHPGHDMRHLTRLAIRARQYRLPADLEQALAELPTEALRDKLRRRVEAP